MKIINILVLSLILGFVLMGCADEETPDETVTVRYTDSYGNTSTDTYDFYYKNGKKVYGDISEDIVEDKEDETKND